MAAAPDPVRVLRERFGHDAFVGRQREVVDAVLAGRDALFVAPTGSGKSLAYQLPALALDGLVLVVSPLVALMKDQCDALRAKGVAAAEVNAHVPRAERDRRLASARAGELDLLYVTPERFRSPAFRAVEGDLPLARLAVDEAHCISQWGHDFRPDYSRLGEVRARLGDPPTIALTATATRRVADDVVASLRLRDPLVVRTGIERPNLFLAATALERPEDRAPALAERIRAIGGKGIAYFALIRDLERAHEELLRRGVRTLVYHGKLSDAERRAMHERFHASEDAVVLATNAFGMGVDEPDVRFVLHAQVPGTLEAWTQEVGRAGRDGEPSWCELLYVEEDLAIQQRFVEWSNPGLELVQGVVDVLARWGERTAARDLDDLREELLLRSRGDERVSIALRWLETLGVVEGSFEDHDLRLARPLDPAELPAGIREGTKREEDLRALHAMARFATDRATCRRALLARHFDLPEPDGPCGACDACADPAAWRAARLAPRTEPAGTTAPEPPRPAGAFRRGDWVRVGRHLGQVVRVEGEGPRAKLVVESATDLRRRTVDARRAERIEG